MSDLDKIIKRAQGKSELHKMIDELEDGDVAVVMVSRDEGEHTRFDAMCWPLEIHTHALVGQIEHVKAILFAGVGRDDHE